MTIDMVWPTALAHSLLHIVTDFGDDAVTGALAVAITAYLLLSKQKNGALMFASAFIATVGTLALAKMALYSQCAPSANFYGVRSPSGHSGLSVVVYGLFAALVSTNLSGWRRVLPFFVAFFLVMAVSVSRILLKAHSVGDVVVGFAVGAIASAAAWALWMRRETVRIDWQRMSLIVLVVLTIMVGAHFSAEGLLTAIARYVRMRFGCT
ncbi:MAG: phosphatase PAP2 family protein [Alphaproteobacteria bacterium]|nr:phosphatase PAP2 family protein [Alphaproteobacteria bacterium]